MDEGRILYDSFDARFKAPFGCIKENERCVIGIEYPVSCGVNRLYLRLEREDGFAMTVPLQVVSGAERAGYQRRECAFSLYEPGLYFYFFEFDTAASRFSLYRLGNHDTNLEEGERWQISCIPADYEPPESFYGRVLYQIFPDRFARLGECDLSEKLTPFTLHACADEPPRRGPDENGLWNNDFYGGNFRGIESRLDYIASLGVGTIYLNPIFKAYSNHRYDTADYMKPDPMLGTVDDFASLCKSAAERGIRIILDGVFSHVGENSVYFDRYGVFGGGAVSDPCSRYRDWFKFRHYPDDYDCWWDVRSLPCVDEMNDGFLDLVIRSEDSVVAHWMRLGAAGFRLDVADELPDGFIALLRRRVRQLNPEGIVIGEVWEDASNKRSYGELRRYFTGGELDGVMNYPFRESILGFVCGELTPENFVAKVERIYENYPFEALLCCMTLLSTHDTPRVLTALREKLGDRALAAEKTAIALQHFLPGMPCIYYGDEAGMEGGGDPDNRRFFAECEHAAELFAQHLAMCALRREHEALRRGRLSLRADGGAVEITRTLGGDAVTLRAEGAIWEVSHN